MCARSTTALLLPALVGAAFALSTTDRLLVTAQPSVSPDERVFGTWQLNVATSKFSPGPPYRTQVRVYERHEKGVKATITTTHADGHSTEVEYIADYDSLEYPVTGSPDYDSIKLSRVDAYTAEAVLGHAGKVFATARRTISEDGKTMTILFQVDLYAGSRVHNVMVYDRR
jgi:hypothetical protein